MCCCVKHRSNFIHNSDTASLVRSPSPKNPKGSASALLPLAFQPPFPPSGQTLGVFVISNERLDARRKDLFFLSVVGDRRVSVWSIRSSKVVPWDVGFIGFGFDWAVNSFGMRLSSLFDHTVVAVLTVVVYRVV